VTVVIINTKIHIFSTGASTDPDSSTEEPDLIKSFSKRVVYLLEFILTPGAEGYNEDEIMQKSELHLSNLLNIKADHLQHLSAKQQQSVRDAILRLYEYRHAQRLQDWLDERTRNKAEGRTPDGTSEPH
jgi:hypothetical protein